MRMSIRKDGTGTLYYQVKHCRTTRLIHSGFSLRASEWDADHETVAMSKVTEVYPEKRNVYIRKNEMYIFYAKTKCA